MNAEEDSMDPMARADMVRAVRRAVEGGAELAAACRAAGATPAQYRAWSVRLDAAGLEALADAPRAGRPRKVVLEADEAEALARRYLKANAGRGAGSVRGAVAHAVADPGSPLRAETREALRPLADGRTDYVPAAVAQTLGALRGTAAAVYRDNRNGTSNGIYTAGWLRRDEETGRFLRPGERQVWDDASPNVPVAVPWPVRGDACADRWGWRAARFQLLAGIDCATDMLVGFGYVLRASDGYRACDVAGTMLEVWRTAGYAPKACVLEGGSWQSAHALDFLRAAGVQVVDAKGRPNQKLVEGYFNRLWTQIALELPDTCSQIGRYRGEMRAETLHWMSVQSGAHDPREFFPTLEVFLGAVERAVTALNGRTIRSRTYGSWVPADLYAGAAANGQPLVDGLQPHALPVRAVRTVGRDGMVGVKAETRMEGLRHAYLFATADGWRWNGAQALVRFDPHRAERGAHLALARPWRGMPAGTLIDAAAPCVSAAPEFTAAAGVADFRGAARAEKRRGMAAVRSVVRAYDGRGRIEPEAGDQRSEIRGQGSEVGGQRSEVRRRRLTDAERDGIEAGIAALVS